VIRNGNNDDDDDDGDDDDDDNNNNNKLYLQLQAINSLHSTIHLALYSVGTGESSPGSKEVEA